jgi:hypothetical protein
MIGVVTDSTLNSNKMLAIEKIDDIPFKEKARVRAVRITQTRHTVDVSIRREGNRHKKKDVTERRESLLKRHTNCPFQK